MAVIGGIYDPAGAFDNSTDLGIDSLYVLDWNKPLSDIGNGMSLTAACALSASRSRTPLVTIQPVANPKITKNPANTLSHIAAGLYDANTRAIAASMNAYGGPAYLRWGPEMDDPDNIGRYEWAVPPEQASDYAAAYRRRTDIYRFYTNNLPGQSFVWSPTPTAFYYLYFPGYSYVDYVGGAVFGWSLYQGASASSFNNQLALIYSQLSSYGKPVMLEIGCEAGDDQATWSSDAKAAFGGYPLLYAAVWYSARDNYPWLVNGPVPDFTATPAVWYTG
jgi:endoglucanase